MDLENLALRLERILRTYLKCHYLEFGVKANDNLLKRDWNSPMNFALGVLYSHNPELKNKINNFLGNELCIGKNMEDVISQFDTREKGICEVEKIINHFEELLEKDIQQNNK